MTHVTLSLETNRGVLVKWEKEKVQKYKDNEQQQKQAILLFLQEVQPSARRMSHQDTGESALYRQTRKDILVEKIRYKGRTTTKRNFSNLGTPRICGTIGTNASQSMRGFIDHLHQAVRDLGIWWQGETKDKCASWKPNYVMAIRHRSSHHQHEQPVIQHSFRTAKTKEDLQCSELRGCAQQCNELRRDYMKWTSG
jgi:hypothetical protein